MSTHANESLGALRRKIMLLYGKRKFGVVGIRFWLLQKKRVVVSGNQNRFISQRRSGESGGRSPTDAPDFDSRESGGEWGE